MRIFFDVLEGGRVIPEPLSSRPKAVVRFGVRDLYQLIAGMTVNGLATNPRHVTCLMRETTP